MVYLITYDLNKSGQNYDGLYDAIKKIGKWWHYLDSTWLVETNMTSGQISEILLKEIDKNDRLLIIRVAADHAGWLTQKAWDWLNDANY
jgi:hypothetical protein